MYRLIYQLGMAMFVKHNETHVCTPERFGDKILKTLF